MFIFGVIPACRESFGLVQDHKKDSGQARMTEILMKALNLEGKLRYNLKIYNSPSPHPSPLRGEGKGEGAGFTLIEVIVAIAILGISFVMIMQLFSGALRASRASCDYTRAVVHAKDKMEELSVAPVQDSGEFEDGFKWESVIQPYKELEDSAFNLLKINVKISWNDALRKPNYVELVSLKVVSNED